MAQEFKTGVRVKTTSGITGILANLKPNSTNYYVIIRDDGLGWKITDLEIKSSNIDPIYLGKNGWYGHVSNMNLEQPENEKIDVYIPIINDIVWIDIYKTHARVISQEHNGYVYVIREDNEGYNITNNSILSTFKVDESYPLNKVYCIPIKKLEKSTFQFHELIDIEKHTKLKPIIKSSPEEQTNKSLTKSKLLEPITIKKRILI